MSDTSLLTGTEPPIATSTPTGEAAATGTPPVVVATPNPAAPDTTGTPPADGATPPADGATDPTKVVADVAPEKYADFKPPEGTEVLAPELVTEVSALAKELNLSQEKAQKVIDTAAKLAVKGVEAQTAAIQTVRTEWVTQVKGDKEITAGPGLEANLATAKAAMLATTTPQFQMLMARSGLGDNPEVIRHFLKIAPAFKEDTHVTGNKAPTDGKSAEKVLYPNNQ